MTICIAALYGDAEGCILCSDQMTTARIPIAYEFESDEVSKIVKAGDKLTTYALIAGDVLFSYEVIQEARKNYESVGITAVSGLAESFRQSYQLIRRTRIIRSELEPRGLDIDSYYKNHQKLLQNVVITIDKIFKEANMGVDLIIAGKEDSKCSIYTIANPGQIVCNDPIGYSAIGTGAPHAVYYLIESGYKKSLDRESVEKLVIAAKKRAQVAPGIGIKTTTISI